MKINSVALLCSLLVTGCQSTQVVDLSQPDMMTVSSIEQLQSQKINLPSSTKIIVSDSTQSLESADINSPTVKIELPVYQGPLSVEVTSYIEDSVFSPLAKIVDGKGNELLTVPASSFSYEKPRLGQGNRLISEFSFFPPSNIDKAYLLVYTDNAELEKQTEVIHPARLDAEARGNYFPEAKDISIPHTKTGELLVDLQPYSAGSFFGLNTEKKEVTQTKPIEANSDTKAYYFSSIEQAVTDNDIPKALALLDEAKALNIEGAQKVFVKAVNSKK
jgi:maltose operon protein